MKYTNAAGEVVFEINPITGAIVKENGQTYSPGGGGPHTHPQSDITNLTTDLAAKEATANKGVANGYASLGADGKVPSDQLPASSGGLGYALTAECINQATTTDAQTVYWGGKNLAQQTTADIHRIYIPKAGTIKVCYAHYHAATAGTAENWSLYIRKNNTTDTLVQTVGLSNAHRVFSNTGLSIAVVAGDYIELKEVMPTWATNPANVRRSAVIYVE
jgi:hypothetical protein